MISILKWFKDMCPKNANRVWYFKDAYKVCTLKKRTNSKITYFK